MKIIKNEQIAKNVAKSTIKIDSKTFEEGMQKAYQKNAKHISIPGFRKGKVPRKMIEKYYGEAVFYEDAINFVCPDAYEAAIKETGISPVDQPAIDVEEIGEGKDLVITATVTVKPEVTLGKYAEITGKKIRYKATEEDVDAEIDRARQQNARIITVEDRAVKAGDMTTIDFEGFTDGVAFEGGKGTDYPLEIGSGAFIPGFEDQLIGAEIGKEVDVNVTFPEEYHAEELKGKPAVFKVTVKEIKEKELPELNDDFAKDVSEFDTLEEYKADILAKLNKANKERMKVENENLVLGKVVENAEVEIPEAMINNQLNNIARDFDYRLSAQGLNLEKYLQLTGSTLDAFKEQFKEQAESQVKSTLVLEAIAKAENMTIEDDEFKAELEKMAKDYNMELDKLETLLRDEDKDAMKEEMLNKKALEFIVKVSKLR